MAITISDLYTNLSILVSRHRQGHHLRHNKNIDPGLNVIHSNPTIPSGCNLLSLLQLISNIRLDNSGYMILAATLVDVNNARLRLRSSLPLPSDSATRVAVELSATATPARFIMYSTVWKG